MPSRVSIVRVESEATDLREAVHKAVQKSMDLVNWRRHLRKGEETFIKFNMTWCDFLLPGMCTSPWVLEGVIKKIQGYVGKISLVEGIAAARQSFEKGCRINGYDKVAKEFGVEIRNVGIEPTVEITVPKVPFRVKMPRIVLGIPNYISAAPMKTHSVSKFTGVLKNSFGVTHHKRVLYHFFLADVIAYINKEILPTFAVIDGTVAIEGNGPANGKPIETNLVIASPDLVAADATACRVMGINPEEVDHIVASQKAGLGTIDPVILGENIENIRQKFETAKPQLYAEIMFRIMHRPLLKKLVFDHLWQLGTLGVQLLRNAWYFYEGSGFAKSFLKNSRYREEWQVKGTR